MKTPYQKMALGASDYEALCGLCETPLEGPKDAKANDTFRCSNCGDSDTLENVRRIIHEYATEHMAKALQSTIRKTVRGSKSLTFTPGFRPKGEHRFIVNLESH